MTLNVIIPVYNQAFALAQTLWGFTQQNPPYNYSRIIIVDDGSEEPIDAVIAAYSNELNLEYIRLPRSGRAAARNAGVRAADSELIVFCDADRIPRPGFLAAHARSHSNADEQVTVGHVKEMYVSSPQANRNVVIERYMNDRMLRTPQYCKLVYKLFDVQGATSSPIAWVATLSGNLSMPTETIRAIGGFDGRFKEWGFEHMEFGYRVHKKGVPFRYEADAANVHIAHSRGGQSYSSLIMNSHAVFHAKHADRAVERYLDFMLGKISLRQFEREAGSETASPPIMLQPDEDGYVRVTS
ncbi:GT2 family glycosyltransferase [Paenibacillus cellulosilyticus]|uniref:GT2 family glycosyltransferase n=2 Tax=Paenibacillus cellulosilyticus TaxID=375489 RepID=A0A2V2YUU9_9BACL|nr:GT2 family glycosyltransferase [Paenibacillus cellulosilyticus]